MKRIFPVPSSSPRPIFSCRSDGTSIFYRLKQQLKASKMSTSSSPMLCRGTIPIHLLQRVPTVLEQSLELGNISVSGSHQSFRQAIYILGSDSSVSCASRSGRDVFFFGELHHFGCSDLPIPTFFVRATFEVRRMNATEVRSESSSQSEPFLRRRRTKRTLQPTRFRSSSTASFRNLASFQVEARIVRVFVVHAKRLDPFPCASIPFFF